MSDPRPLDGVRILDLTRLLPGGYCTMLLSDLGADVLKVEEPGKGDYIRWMPPFYGETSSGHLALNRGKRSMTLNLKHPEGAEVLKRMAGSYDVLVESFRPGVMDRLGVGYDTLAGINPGLVYCAITGYGQDGPYKDKAGHDANYLGYAGVTDLNGARTGPPLMVGVQIADVGGGGLMGAVGILAALQGKAATHKGRFVDISMTDGALSWIGFHLQPHFFTGEPILRQRGRINGRLACYQLYECGDGRWISVGALEPQFWEVFCNAIGVPEFIARQHAEAEEEQDAMADHITKVLSAKSRAEWLDILEDLESCVGPINTIEEALRDPHILARGMVAQVPTDAGPVPTIASPIRDRGQVTTAYPPAPGFGEHTDATLAEVGYDAAAIASLRDAGAI